MKYLTICILLFLSVLCNAQQDSIVPFEKAYKRIYNITKVDGIKPLMDGKLDEDFWNRQGEWSERFIQIIPYERVVSPSPTRVKLFYDDKYIYIGVHCKDEHPEKMNRFIGNRDDNSLGDLISIAFDTYHDFRAAPEFNINLGGNKTDLVVTDKLNINRSWNAVWEGRTHINLADSSWTAELRIPFSQLRYNQLSGDGIWGLHVRRVIRRNNEVQNWSMIPMKNNGHVFSFGEMHGMTDLPQPKGIEFLPYVMGKYRDEPRIPGSPYQKGHSWGGNAGLDAKFALSDFTLDLTINPDYGQVELDPSVMNLTAYETFYEEKRPFFLEGKHILDFANGNDMMFYTRRIGDAPSYMPGVDKINSFMSTKENVPIIGALKLTGTNRRGVTIGIVQSVTAQSSAKFTQDGKEDKIVVEPLTNYTVARIQKNWKGNTLLGGMLTSVNRALDEAYLKDFMVRNAFTAGVDFTQYFNNRLYYIDMKGMFSSLNGSREAITALQNSAVHYYQRVSSAGYLGVDPTRRSLNGTGGYVKAGRKGNAKWAFSETFSWSSPGFDLNDIGYLKETDNLTNETEIAYRQTDIWKIFRYNAFTLTQKNQWNYGGTLFNSEAALRWQSMTMNRYEVDIKETFRWNSLDSRLLRGGPDVRFNPYFLTSVTANTDKAKRVMFMFQYEGNHNLDSYNRYNTLMPSLTFRLGNHIYLSGQVNYTWNTDNMQYIGKAEGIPSSGNPEKPQAPLYLVGHMKQKTYGLTMKLQVNVTPDISVQFYGAPFSSTATFDKFQYAANTTSHTYANRFQPIAVDELNVTDNMYHFSHRQADYSFNKPDFSFNEFRSNLVARWEYLPGSTIYFVWEHRMSDRSSRTLSGWGKNLDRMFGLPATNTFMIKMNYWFDL